MAYPFGPPIPFNALIQRLTSQYGCEVHATKVARVSPDTGDAVRFRYLLRRTSNGIMIANLPDTDPTTEMMPSVVRSVCRQLGVNPNDFGILDDRDTDD